MASNLLFAATDLRLAGPVLVQAYLLKLPQLGVALAGIYLLRRLRQRAAMVGLVFVVSAVVCGIVALSGALTHDVVTTTILCVAFALGSATLLPWGAAEQCGIALIAGLSILLNIALTTHDLSLAVSYPAVAVVIALGVSVYLAQQLEVQRLALAGAYQAQRVANETLEARVRQRTAEIEEANQRLRDSQRRFRTISELTSDYSYALRIGAGMTSTSEWVTGPSFTRITGYTPEEVDDLGGGLAIVHSDDLEIVRNRITALLAGRADVSEFRIIRKDGAVRWIREHGYGEWDPTLGRVTGIHAAAEDITPRRIAEEALRESETHYRLLFENNPCPLAVFDRETLQFLSVNAAAAQHYGYTREEFLGMVLTDIRTVADLRRVVLPGELGSPGSLIGLWRHETKSGQVIEVNLTATDLVFKGRPAVLVQVNDVTERRAAEREVRRLNADLERRVQERTDQLSATNRELESFSYSVSHDLQAPLRHLQGFATILAQDHADDLGADGRRCIGRLQVATKRMDGLIAGILTLSKVSAAALRTVRIDLATVATDIFSELRISEPHRVARCVVQANLSVRGDPDLLRIVLQNLLGNAWKYTANHSAAQIEFGALQQEGKTVFFVRDDGAGFDMTYADDLFTPFRRLHDSSQFEGSGIGLATVQRVVHRHGGRVWAEGAVEHGATFYFTVDDAPSGIAAEAVATRALAS
ncbi:MAG: PAS domain S-box protein [bacterium]